MKKIYGLLVFLLIVMMFTACGQEEQVESGYQIYRVNKEGTTLETESYTPKAEGGDELIQELIDQLTTESAVLGYRKAIPDGVGITSAVCKEKNLRVDFNGTYSDMDNITEAFCRAAVVKTLVQVPEVDTVEITVNGQELADSQGNPVGVMNNDSFIDTKGEAINSYQYTALTLYFPDESGELLKKELRNIYYSSNENQVRLVLEELLKGPEKEGMYPATPTDTKVLDVSVDGEKAVVNLNSVFGQTAMDQVSAKATIYAIVNTLCENCDLEQVQIQIEGETVEKYLDQIEIGSPLKEDTSMVAQEESGSEKTPGVGVDPALQE
jgi:germination protein M